MDVLACHQFGETNVVASMGTVPTEPQLKLLKRYTDTFILALDADTAGQAATLRGIEQARESLDREWSADSLRRLAWCSTKPAWRPICAS